MKAFQEYLHIFEAGWGKRLFRYMAILVLLGFVALAWHAREYRGPSSVEGFNAAQIARNVAEGRGYTTLYITPMEMARLLAYYATPAGSQYAPGGRLNLLAVPELGQPPLYPYSLGLFMKLGRAPFNEEVAEMARGGSFKPDQYVALYNYIVVFATGAVMLVWVSRMFDRRVGTVAVVGLALCLAVWQSADSAEGMPLLMFCITAMFALLHEALWALEEERRLAVWIALPLSALFLVAAAWTKMVMLCIYPLYVLTVMLSFRAQIIPALIAVLLVPLLVSPWFLRNYQVSGDPFGIALRQVAVVPRAAVEDPPEIGSSMEERSLRDSGWDGVLGMAYRKALFGINYTSGHFFTLLGSNIIIALFFVSLLHVFRRWRAHVIRLFLVGCLPLVVVAGAMFNPYPEPGSGLNLMLAFWPAMAAFGVAFFYVLLDRLNLPFLLLRYLIMTAFVIVVALPLAIRLGPPGARPYHYPPYFPPVLRITGELLGPREVIVSDVPWATAWYGGRPSILIPSRMDEFYEINDSIVPINGMLLTPYSWNRPLMEIEKGKYPDWTRVIKRQGVPSDFPLRHFLPMHPRKNDYYFFGDRNRWQR